MKLPESTKSKITQQENGENLPYLEITEIVLILWNVVNNSYQKKNQDCCIHLFLINHLVNYIFHLKTLYF